MFRTAPDPAASWVTFKYTCTKDHVNGAVVVKDATGRVLAQLPMRGMEGQLVFDLRELAQGLYTVEYVNGDAIEQLDKLIVQ